MREVKHYYCDICNTMYNDKKMCDKCEKSHMKPKGFTGESKYNPITMQSQYKDRNYPEWMNIEFEDGITLKYHRG